MPFDPDEPRGPGGKWIKIAKNLKAFGSGTSGEANVVQHALQELPKGGHGNLITLNKGVQIRRHQSGGFSVKINGEARHYSSHEHAASAVIDRKHNEHGVLKPGQAAKSSAPSSSLPKSNSAASKITFESSGYKPQQLSVHLLAPGDVIVWDGKTHIVKGNVTTAGASQHLTLESVATGKSESVLPHYTHKVTVVSKAPEESVPAASATKPKPKYVQEADKQYNKGLITAEEYYHKTGKYPNDEAAALQAEIGPSKPPTPTTPYSNVEASTIVKGDVIKFNGQHWKVQSVKSAKPSMHDVSLEIRNAQGVDSTKLLFNNDKVEKSNTPDKFVDAPTVKAQKAPAYDPKSELPAGVLVGYQAWDSLPKVVPPTTISRNAVKSYTSSGYVEVNAGLRKGLFTASTEKLITGIDDAFANVDPTTEDVVVHRGFHSSDSLLGNLGSHIGGVFIDNGFISTSTKESTASSFGGGTVVDIIIPKGSRVLKTEGLSSHPSEMEVILNRGSKFRIISDKMVTTTIMGMTSQKRRVQLRLVTGGN